MGDLKTCKMCGTAKPLTEFHIHKRCANGRRPQCKGCRKADSRDYYLANTEAVRSRTASWQRLNSDRVQVRKKAWAARNPDKILAKRQRYRKEKGKEINRRELERDRKKQRTNPAHRLSSLVSRQICMALRGQKNGWSWERLVGYTRQDLKHHIERQFTKGMTWHDIATGAIHIDHIRAVSSFAFDGPNHPDFKACWALTNLRPLWAKDNLSKGARRTHLL